MGLNLTMASTVVLCEPWWNPFAEMQAIDRTHRIGQTREVRVFRLATPGTVEERVLALQERKQAMAAATLGEASRSRRVDAARLSERDFMQLFGVADGEADGY